MTNRPPRDDLRRAILDRLDSFAEDVRWIGGSADIAFADSVIALADWLAASELRAAAAALSSPSEGAAYELWAYGGGDWLRARADAVGRHAAPEDQQAGAQ